MGYSALLGPIGGIMIADYYLLRHQQLDVPDLYRQQGRYTYQKGVNYQAMLALALGILPNIPGFLQAVGALPAGTVWPWLAGIYYYAWFVGFLLAGGLYVLLMRPQFRSAPASSVAAELV
ncbi:cytosine permease [Hymenobacter psychrotolerans]|uniref:cytosine permease n=1 Tax=Hymenobacter psychrotolerans TaxID=344998 RepID=UPI001FCDE1A3|nr:cytosine permease [Hymenobacter psychrotolerans]